MHPKYKHMISVMLDRENAVEENNFKNKKCSEGLDEKWFLYILRCSDGSLYTGITKDLERRFKMHSEGKASRYTRTRRPLKLVYKEACGNHASALVRECQIKEFSKDRKEKLTETYTV